ncbi:MAG: FliM/FliN family flagellar motor C-terminal domain-containing protein [Candidatus Eremiobacteraeota bacterium]|nr:FliM/FliN family flagellar motor C-terminal domain-containing protein [Candidatus Eremiobacteraeota bacterium]
MNNEEASEGSRLIERPSQSKPQRGGGGPPKAPPGAPPDVPGSGGSHRWGWTESSSGPYVIVRGELGRLKMPLQEARRLKINDILTLDRDEGDPAVISINGKEVGKGNIESIGHQTAIQIFETIPGRKLISVILPRKESLTGKYR